MELATIGSLTRDEVIILLQNKCKSFHPSHARYLLWGNIASRDSRRVLKHVLASLKSIGFTGFILREET